MAMWRCPHCATPQPEAARCWVCHRSSTCCATCRDFRRSVAGGLGFCGLDARRWPLRGDELRGCWRPAERTEPTEPSAPEPRTGVRNRREFVPLDTAVGVAGAGPAPMIAAASAAASDGPADRRTTPARMDATAPFSLFPELEA